MDAEDTNYTKTVNAQPKPAQNAEKATGWQATKTETTVANASILNLERSNGIQ